MLPIQPVSIQRIQDIYEVDAPAHTKQRIGLLANVRQRLSRRGHVGGKVELTNAALAVLCELLYEHDDDGRFANVDARTSRILIPLPWGRAGCRVWELRASEGKALRHIMLRRSEAEDAWLKYDTDSRSWYLAKPLSRHATEYLLRNPITPAEWREAWAATRTAWAADKLALG